MMVMGQSENVNNALNNIDYSLCV